MRLCVCNQRTLFTCFVHGVEVEEEVHHTSRRVIRERDDPITPIFHFSSRIFGKSSTNSVRRPINQRGKAEKLIPYLFHDVKHRAAT